MESGDITNQSIMTSFSDLFSSLFSIIGYLLSGQPQLQVVLQSACSNMAHRYGGELAAHVAVLLRSDVSDLVVVREELFRNGVNWGRIVAMMGVGGALCTEVARTGESQQVKEIADWMAEGLDTLQGWIEDNGGWVMMIYHR